MTAQIYEEYWKITFAYTNFTGQKSIEVLQTIVDFINSNNKTNYSENKYKDLQNKIKQITNIGYPSVRKAINQFVKLGFINVKLKGYPEETLEFLNAKMGV